MTAFSESIVEEAALAVFGRLGWTILHGPRSRWKLRPRSARIAGTAT